MSMPLRKPDGLNWNPASVELPEIPMLPAGQDALSATISAVLPTLAAPLAANVATLQAKESMFAGKLGAAQTAYQNSDDAGSQSVGQVVGMLGQLGQQAGQMAQSAGAPAQALGGQTGMFGSLMQQAMQGAQGGGQSSGGQGAAALAAGAAGPAGAAGAAPHLQREEAGPDEATRPREGEDSEPLMRADDTARGSGGPAPVTGQEPARHGEDEDIARRL